MLLQQAPTVSLHETSTDDVAPGNDLDTLFAAADTCCLAEYWTTGTRSTVDSHRKLCHRITPSRLSGCAHRFRQSENTRKNHRDDEQKT